MGFDPRHANRRDLARHYAKIKHDKKHRDKRSSGCALILFMALGSFGTISYTVWSYLA